MHAHNDKLGYLHLLFQIFTNINETRKVYHMGLLEYLLLDSGSVIKFDGV